MTFNALAPAAQGYEKRPEHYVKAGDRVYVNHSINSIGLQRNTKGTVLGVNSNGATLDILFDTTYSSREPVELMLRDVCLLGHPRTRLLSHTS